MHLIHHLPLGLLTFRVQHILWSHSLNENLVSIVPVLSLQILTVSISVLVFALKVSSLGICYVGVWDIEFLMDPVECLEFTSMGFKDVADGLVFVVGVWKVEKDEDLPLPLSCLTEFS